MTFYLENGHPPKLPHEHKPVSTTVGPPNPLDVHYITLRGVSSISSSVAGQQITIMSGDEKPQIKSGYGKWSVVDRPLQTGVTTFQGYDPVSMTLSLKFGVWGSTTGNFSGAYGWDTSAGAAKQVEAQIQVLEWMAGAGQQAGPPPYVYANSYDALGITSDLIPHGYQSVGSNGAITSPTEWPWIIDGGIEWGTSYSNAAITSGYTTGQRVYQECTLTLRNFMGFTQPASVQKAGSYFISSGGHDTCNKIAAAPSVVAMSPPKLASEIRLHHKNNPIRNTKYELQRKSLSSVIPHGYQVWVPSHVV